MRYEGLYPVDYTTPYSRSYIISRKQFKKEDKKFYESSEDENAKQIPSSSEDAGGER